MSDLTPEQRRDVWARAEAFQGVREGWLREDLADDYAAALAKSLRGQGVAIGFALDDVKAALDRRAPPSVAEVLPMTSLRIVGEHRMCRAFLCRPSGVRHTAR